MGSDGVDFDSSTISAFPSSLMEMEIYGENLNKC
jgi:hypothetical protein